MLGKLHLLLLHFPIGFLMASLALDLLGRWRKRTDFRTVGYLSLRVGAISAVLAAGCGWLLAQSGGYEAEAILWHQWLGFATCAFALATWYLYGTKWHLLTLCCTVGVLSAAGHLGGNITHGENYLFEPLIEMAISTPADFKPEANAFQVVIKPILEKKCYSCHNASKSKGAFRMDTPELLFKGGKHGKAILAGKPNESLLLSRPLLPIQHDEHMPPSGKIQLTDDEIKLLRWWIQEGADLNKTIQETPLNKEVMHLFSGSGQAKVENPVFKLTVPAANEADMAALRTQGAAVAPLFQGSPWLTISWTGNKKLDATKIALLEKVSEQVVHLDLSHTNVTDEILKKTPKLPHLTRLHLAQTPISDATIQTFASSTYLEYLNLTGTQVSDAGMAALVPLLHLRTLYVWNSKVTEAGLQPLKSAIPAIKVDLGAPKDTSSSVLQLSPPKFLYSRTIFSDTMILSIDFPKMVDLHYTTTGASPTTQSPKYEGGEIVLDQTTRIRALTVKPGWKESKEVDMEFRKKKLKFNSVTLAKPSDTKFDVQGGPPALGDGRIADHTGDKTYLAYQGDDLIATIDLGSEQPIHLITAHAYEATGAWVFFPKGMRVTYSNDLKNWTSLLDVKYPPEQVKESRVRWIKGEAPKAATARYVKVHILNIGRLPAWHPNKGEKAWVFIDEIMIE